MYVLNVKKGSTINHPIIGKIEGGVAYEVDECDALQLKHIINLIVFDSVVKKNT